MKARFAILAYIALASCSPLWAKQPVGWRHDTSGLFPGAAPPTAWSLEEGIVWKARLPAGSNASPVVVGDRVFVCAEPTRLLCLSAKDGALLWEAEHGYEMVLSPAEWKTAQRDLERGNAVRKRLDELRKEIGEIDQMLQDKKDDPQLQKRRQATAKKLEAGERELAPLDRYRLPERSAGCTTATPVSDGRYVYTVFGTGIVVCHDLDGQQQWIRLFDKPKLDWGQTASPLLIGDFLLVHLTDLTALDPATGETRWTADVAANYGSPVPCRAGDSELVVTSAGDVVRVADGEVLAKGIVERLSACSPIANGDMVYFIQKQARAVRLPADLSSADPPETVWESKLFDDNYYASPLLHDGLIYAVSENRVLTVLGAENGETVYEQRLRFKSRGAVTSSLAAVGDQILIMQENGITKVLRAGREYQELAENPLESLRSSPVAADGRLYIRCSEHLYCIGE